MISVCVATYNGEKYIAEQLRSILSQLSASDEVIVSDDGSSDATLEKVSALRDGRIRILLNTKAGNRYRGIFRTIYDIGRNVENALKAAVGDHIFLADQDDVWTDDKVAVVLKALSEADCVVHDCTVVDENKALLGGSLFDVISPRASLIGTLYRSSFMGCCMAFNRNVLERAIPFPAIPVEHDTWLGLCALKTGRVTMLKDKLILYRRHRYNVSSCGEGSRNSLPVKLKRRLVMLDAYRRIRR